MGLLEYLAKETGGKAALPAWIRIIEALPHKEGERFPMPDEAVLVPWDGQWIALPRGSVPRGLLRTQAVQPGLPLAAFGR